MPRGADGWAQGLFKVFHLFAMQSGAVFPLVGVVTLRVSHYQSL